MVITSAVKADVIGGIFSTQYVKHYGHKTWTKDSFEDEALGDNIERSLIE